MSRAGGSLVPLPPSRSLLPAAPCPDQDSAGPAARASIAIPGRAAGPARPSTSPEEEQKAEASPCAEGRLCSAPLAPRGAGCRSGHTDTGQFGVGVSFSQRGDKKHLQPRTGQSLAVSGDRAGHTESCHTPPAHWDGAAGSESALPSPRKQSWPQLRIK